MTNEEAVIHFRNIMYCLMEDNGCDFDSAGFESAAARCICEMSAAGVSWPKDHDARVAAMMDVNSIYWQLAAGETSEVFSKFSAYHGYAELNDILNLIFEQG